MLFHDYNFLYSLKQHSLVIIDMHCLFEFGDSNSHTLIVVLKKLQSRHCHTNTTRVEQQQMCIIVIIDEIDVITCDLGVIFFFKLPS